MFHLPRQRSSFADNPATNATAADGKANYAPNSTPIVARARPATATVPDAYSARVRAGPHGTDAGATAGESKAANRFSEHSRYPACGGPAATPRCRRYSGPWRCEASEPPVSKTSLRTMPPACLPKRAFGDAVPGPRSSGEGLRAGIELAADEFRVAGAVGAVARQSDAHHLRVSIESWRSARGPSARLGAARARRARQSCGRGGSSARSDLDAEQARFANPSESLLG